MELVPVVCPRCGESQNQLTGDSVPERQKAKTVACMVCQYEFADEEYRSSLELAWQEIKARLQQRSGPHQ